MFASCQVIIAVQRRKLPISLGAFILGAAEARQSNVHNLNQKDGSMDITSRYRKWREERPLQKALTKCRRATRDGYQIASKNLDGIKIAIDGVSADLKQNLSSLNHSQINTNDVNVQLQKQLQQAVSELYQLHKKSRASLEEKRTQLDKFSIALFGRTMTGKSTLMEILTKGDGSSIGKGSQRTTRDVRGYEWK